MKNELLIVYNTCGISGKTNTEHYLNSLSSILRQYYKDYKLVVSSCKNTPECREVLQTAFEGTISFNWIDEVLPVNVTFNHSVQKAREEFGDFDNYMYIDSGCSFNDPTDLDELVSLHNSGPNAMTGTRTTTDSGVNSWFGVTDDVLFSRGPFTVPIGKAFNLHVQIFSHDLVEAYGNIIPDIFASYCTESTFSFLCAAIKKNWVVAHNIMVDHIWSMDGASSGFNPHGVVAQYMEPWKHLFRSKRSMEEIIADPKGIRSGFGYEEVCGVMLHDKEQFDDNFFCKNDELKEFIADNLFLTPDLLDYKEIIHTYIPQNG